MQAAVIKQHHDESQEESAPDEDERWKTVPPLLSVMVIPQCEHDRVLHEDNGVEEECSVASASLLHVEETEDVDDADDSVEQHLLESRRAEVGVLIDQPQGHPDPVDAY